MLIAILVLAWGLIVTTSASHPHFTSTSSQSHTISSKSCGLALKLVIFTIIFVVPILMSSFYILIIRLSNIGRRFFTRSTASSGRFIVHLLIISLSVLLIVIFRSIIVIILSMCWVMMILRLTTKFVLSTATSTTHHHTTTSLFVWNWFFLKIAWLMRLLLLVVSTFVTVIISLWNALSSLIFVCLSIISFSLVRSIWPVSAASSYWRLLLLSSIFILILC